MRKDNGVIIPATYLKVQKAGDLIKWAVFKYTLGCSVKDKLIFFVIFIMLIVMDKK